MPGLAQSSGLVQTPGLVVWVVVPGQVSVGARLAHQTLLVAAAVHQQQAQLQAVVELLASVVVLETEEEPLAAVAAAGRPGLLVPWRPSQVQV